MEKVFASIVEDVIPTIETDETFEQYVATNTEDMTKSSHASTISASILR